VIGINLLDVQSFYLNNPPREYRTAFNLVARKMSCSGGKNLCIVSSTSVAVELIKRCQQKIHLTGTDNFNVRDFLSVSEGWTWGAIKPVALDRSKPEFEIIFWGLPEISQLEAISCQAYRCAASKATLIVVSPGPLHNLLPGVKSYPGCWLMPRALVRALSKGEWQIKSAVGIHGLRSIFWGRIYQMCNLLKRLDWADRSLFAVRDVYLEAGMFWWLSPLLIIHAVKN
jgi:hypothetical protein